MPPARTQNPLAAAFERSDLTQRELAQKVGVSESHVNRWLNGVHQPGRLYKREIARALGIRVEEIWPR